MARAKRVNHSLSTGRTKMGRLRLHADLTQKDLAERTGLSLTTINLIEGGRIDDPGIIHLLLIARELGVGIEKLVEDCWREGMTLRQAEARGGGRTSEG